MQLITRRASARRSANFSHTISIRDHQLVSDEPRSAGGDDEGPSPEELLAASLASCTAITMEMYAQRKGWELGPVEVDVQYSPAERGCPTKFELVLHLPAQLADDQVDQLRVIAAKCPIHRTLDGEVMFSERVERVNLTR
jgi:putative redox protein